MAGKVVWHGDAFSRKFAAEMGKRLDASAITVVNHVRQLISVDGTARGAPGRGAGGRFTKGKLIYGANPSSPGQPPHVQTGRLRGSMAWERDGFVARVGTNVRYARPLEQGSTHLAARPFLLRGLNEMTPRIRAILSKPMDLS